MRGGEDERGGLQIRLRKDTLVRIQPHPPESPLAVSSVGRALALQARRRRFEPGTANHCQITQCVISSNGQSVALRTRRLGVRFPHDAPCHASLAQMAEQLTLNQKVVGSIPTGRTITWTDSSEGRAAD